MLKLSGKQKTKKTMTAKVSNPELLTRSEPKVTMLEEARSEAVLNFFISTPVGMVEVAAYGSKEETESILEDLNALIEADETLLETEFEGKVYSYRGDDGRFYTKMAIELESSGSEEAEAEEVDA